MHSAHILAMVDQLSLYHLLLTPKQLEDMAIRLSVQGQETKCNADP